MKAKLKLILVDDHLVLRDALAEQLNKHDEFSVIAVAAEGEEMVARLKENLIPDLIILDLNMQGMDGYETARYLKKNYPLIRVLVLTMYESEIPLIRMLSDGARGFLKKDVHPSELKLAILTVMEQGYYYSNDCSTQLATLFTNSEDILHALSKGMLTDTEIKFLKYACSDLTYKEIAGLMKVTPRAVDGFRDAMFMRLDVKSRVGLAIFALKNGLVTF